LIGAILCSLALGWWSLHGLVMTPIQIVRNIGELASRRGRSGPSKALQDHARLLLAGDVASELSDRVCRKCGEDVRRQREIGVLICPRCGSAISPDKT
jgi:ribosomal protein L37AE/L43A